MKEAFSPCDGVWNLTPEGSAAYLVIGRERALMIDTSFGEADVLAEAKKHTTLPIELVNTHGHDDHTGRNADFERCHVHPGDVRKVTPHSQAAVPVNEGHVFDLGGRCVEVLEIPGHTPGSIALFDRANRILFTGDTVSDAPIFFVEGDYDAEQYLQSLDKLLALRGEVDRIFCCHGSCQADMTLVEKLRAAARAYIDGELTPRRVDEPFPADLYLTAERLGFIRPL